MWRDSPCSWIGICNIVKMPVLSNLIHTFGAISINFPESYFVDIDKLILKFIWKSKRSKIANTIWRKNKSGDWRYMTLRLTIKL